MNKLWYFVGVLMILVTIGSASAELTTDILGYHTFDTANITGTTSIDELGLQNGTLFNVDTGQVGILGEALYSSASDDIEFAQGYHSAMESNDFSYSFWLNPNITYSAQTYTTIFNNYQASTDSIAFWFDAGKISSSMLPNGGTWNKAEYTTDLTTGTWYFITVTHDVDTKNNSLYFNGVYRSSIIYTGDLDNYNNNLQFGADNLGHAEYNGIIDEFGIWNKTLNSSEISELYNSGSAFAYPFTVAPPPANGTPVHAENLEQTAFIEQNATTTINSIAYATVFSSAVVIPEDTQLYGSSTIPILPVASNQADCRITIDGAEFNQSETSRSLTAGNWGNMLITSFEETILAGTYDFGLECKRTGGGAFDVVNSTLYLHILTSTTGVEIPHTHLNVTSAPASGIITTDVITTSENATATGLTRALIMEWAGTYDYTADGNISVTTELGGVNCTPIKRYGDSGSIGSVAGACYLDIGNETNSTNYTINVYAEGTGNILNGVFHVKEIIPHINEINGTSLNGNNITSNLSVVDSIGLTIASHSSPNLVTETVIDVLSTSGTQTSSYYLSDGATNSSIVSRTGDFNEAGVLGVQYEYGSVSGSKTISLIGSCSACTLIGGDMIAYLTDATAITPNEFVVTAKSIWDDSAINEFSINLSDGRSFSTTTGSITVPTSEEGIVLNVTFAEQTGTAIPFFTNTTLSFNTTADLDQYLTPYTAIYSSWNGTAVNNFSVTDGSTNYPTTDGTIYLPLYNNSYNVMIYDADADTGQELANQNATLTASDYLQNYTFTMLYPNSFNFSIRDEITDALITANMTIELITGATAGTYTTTNGTLLLELLTPSDYTIRYRSTLDGNYTERDFIQTLTNRERYDVELFSILTVDSTDMIVTIKDTGGDPVENAEVSLLRYYVDCNCYKVVEMSQTSVSGQAYFVADAYDGHYKFTVNYQGTNYFLSTSPENFVPDGVTGIIERTISINLGQAYFQSYRALTNVGRSINYNETTKGLSFTWSDPSGLVTSGCLYASYLDGVHYTDVTPACQNASTGSVVLLLNDSTNSFKYYAEIETSTTYSNYIPFSGYIQQVKENLMDDDLGLGAFLGAGILIVLALMFSFSAIAVMIVTAVGVIGLSALGIVGLLPAFVTGFAVLIIGFGAYLMRS